MRNSAENFAQVSLELGGKSPFIVFADADLDSAVEGVIDAIWFNQGQVCCAGSRLLVQESVAGELHDRIRRRMSKLVVGPSMDKGVDIGALVDESQLNRVSQMVSQGVEEGGKLWQPRCELPESGHYYPPTLVTDVQPSYPC